MSQTQSQPLAANQAPRSPCEADEGPFKGSDSPIRIGTFPRVTPIEPEIIKPCTKSVKGFGRYIEQAAKKRSTRKRRVEDKGRITVTRHRRKEREQFECSGYLEYKCPTTKKLIVIKGNYLIPLIRYREETFFIKGRRISKPAPVSRVVGFQRAETEAVRPFRASRDVLPEGRWVRSGNYILPDRPLDSQDSQLLPSPGSPPHETLLSRHSSHYLSCLILPYDGVD
ncbi:hypothetical protein B0O99DRAFT_590347 [Bisporella sp. PMI_857]|nr:hypothetical protein B0O99DRAFT_590347 [Bisporella sp. PMI_857]